MNSLLLVFYFCFDCIYYRFHTTMELEIQLQHFSFPYFQFEQVRFVIFSYTLLVDNFGKLKKRLQAKLGKTFGAYDDFAPMIDKAVDATWSKAIQNDKFAISKGT